MWGRGQRYRAIRRGLPVGRLTIPVHCRRTWPGRPNEKLGSAAVMWGTRQQTPDRADAHVGGRRRQAHFSRGRIRAVERLPVAIAFVVSRGQGAESGKQFQTTEATAYSGSILMLLPHGLPNLICRTGSELHIIDQYVFEALPSLTGI